jgi:thiol-disulfide isomerase/thioredoxin
VSLKRFGKRNRKGCNIWSRDIDSYTGRKNQIASSTSVQFFFWKFNFLALLTVARKLLLFYHATRCIHCQRLEPTLEAAAKILHSSHTDASERKVKVGKIDGATERALASRFNIRGFPSIFLIDGWEVREYEGPRTVSFFSFNCWKC